MHVVADSPAATLETLVLGEGYAALGEDFVERRDPTPLPDPYLIATSGEVARLVELQADQMDRPELVLLAAGNARFGAIRPFAAVYAGHQFGTFVPRLGDGRAITLGEQLLPSGARFEWQLKGAGPTAFSRFGDGRAVLRSTIREFLCSEAMAALGIPTTRALAIAGSAEPVFRETPETAAVLTRVAPSLIRFGTFEFFHYQRRSDAVKTLADYTITRFYPHLSGIAVDADRYAAFFGEVVARTAATIARWQAVGFAHGVMNTDNMSILGLTLDYGPFGFLDAYEPGFICNHTDEGGRYAFDRQPTIGLWNCQALAAALSSLIDQSDAETVLATYEHAFRTTYVTLLCEKFGLLEVRDDDAELFGTCFRALENGSVDYTRFFTALGDVADDTGSAGERLAASFDNAAQWSDWQRRYAARVADDPRSPRARRAAMSAVNPRYVLRNYLAQDAIAAAQRGDYAEIARLQAALQTPFDERPEYAAYAAAPPESARAISVSCSS